jgi:hypothetical protein
LVSSFTASAASSTTGAVATRRMVLNTRSNSRLATTDTPRPPEKPSEKISQDGLRLRRSTRPDSRSMKLANSCTLTPVVLARSRSSSGNALRRSSSASTTSDAPSFTR